MPSGGVQIGARYVWGGEEPFGLLPTDRFRHLYIIGQTGTGKSTLMRGLILQDILHGEGCALIDPHGDLADDILSHIPRRRVRDVVILDPSDGDWPVAFNPFYRVPPDERALVARNLVSTIHHTWADSWGPRLEYILFNTIRALLDAPDALRPSFLAVPRLLVEKRYRWAVMQHIIDPGARRFFFDEFNTWSERHVVEAIGPVQNKIGAILENPFILNVIGQWKPTIDLGAIMAKQQVLVVRLSKGRLGEEPARLAGALIVGGILHAAMGRENERRTGFHLFVDEFQNFTTSAFESILSEARKFKLSLCIAHQHIGQLPDNIRKTVFGNVGNVVSFRVGATDAEWMARELGGYQPSLYSTLDRGRVVARVVVAGQARPAFQGRIIPHVLPSRGSIERVRNWHRYCYGRPRHTVESKIRLWLQN